MLKKLLCALLLLSYTIHGQNYVQGRISTTNEIGSRIVLYQLKGVKQLYINNDTISNGAFKIAIPENATKGMYRLFYDMKNQGFVDFIYNKENVELQFDTSDSYGTLAFANSEENIAYHKYLIEIDEIKLNLDSLQVAYFKIKDEKQKEIISIEYASLIEIYDQIQAQHELNTVQKLANHFIKSIRKYYAPEIIPTPQEYLNSEKLHYFDFIDFNDSALINSSLISQKVMDYIFYLNVSDDFEVQNKLYKNAINEVMQKIGENEYIKSELLTLLLATFAQNENIGLIDYIIDDLYSKLPDEYQDKATLNDIQSSVRLVIGKKVPEITWDVAGKTKKLSEIKSATNYIIVFWSTSCPHCLQEIPKLYEYTKNNEAIHVIAIALENDEKEFNKYTSNLKKWTHIVGLNKWENPIAEEYQITATPTYFILDAEKRILSKPEFFIDVKAFFENE